MGSEAYSVTVRILAFKQRYKADELNLYALLCVP